MNYLMSRGSPIGYRHGADYYACGVPAAIVATKEQLDALDAPSARAHTKTRKRSGDATISYGSFDDKYSGATGRIVRRVTPGRHRETAITRLAVNGEVFGGLLIYPRAVAGV